MVNDHLGWSKVICIGQRSLGLNGVDFNTLEPVIRKKYFKTVIRKSPKLKGTYLQISREKMYENFYNPIIVLFILFLFLKLK